MAVRDSLQGNPSDESDIEEQLDHPPIGCHMYRSAFVKQWIQEVDKRLLEEDSAVQAMLGHTAKESPCIFVQGNPPSTASIFLRKNIKVDGKPYALRDVARRGLRRVQDYHFFMYNSGRWTRKELSAMTSSKSVKNPWGASHTCGGVCLNHGIPESNTDNQSRKRCHRRMRLALESGSVEEYKRLRKECKHCNQKCFINPGTCKLTERIIANNLGLYNCTKADLAQRLHEAIMDEDDDEDKGTDSSSEDHSNSEDPSSEDTNSSSTEDSSSEDDKPKSKSKSKAK